MSILPDLEMPGLTQLLHGTGVETFINVVWFGTGQARVFSGSEKFLRSREFCKIVGISYSMLKQWVR